MEYDEQTDEIIMKEATLFEISPVSIPADMNTFAMRSVEQMEDLYDEAEDFIKALPRKFQMNARAIIARYKSLIDLEPLEQRKKALPKVEEPVTAGVDYKHLLQNFKSL